MIPTLAEAKSLLSEAEKRNPGPWIQHSVNVARAAEAIATHHKGLEPERALVLGYLHDIGRREGVTAMRHTLDGYTFLAERGFHSAAQICLTHSFPMPDHRTLETAAGTWDGSAEELEFTNRYLIGATYTDYDRLIQLCDCLALPSGFCLLEQRFVDVTMRHGFNRFTLPRWRAYLDLRTYFEEAVGDSVYRILPGGVEGTSTLTGRFQT